MTRSAVRSLALVLAISAGCASAQDYYDDSTAYDNGDQYGQPYGNEAYAQADVAVGYPGNAGPAYGNHSEAYGDQGAGYDVARVLSVDPIVEQAQPVARQECWSEPSAAYATQQVRYAPEPRRTTGAGAVLGAIVGAALGSTVDGHGHGHGRRHGYGYGNGNGNGYGYGYGHGRGRGHHDDNDGAIVAGALIGGVIGNGIERQSQYRDARYSDGYRGQPAGYYAGQSVQRCRVVNQGGTGETRVAGYRVTYEYAGRRYETVTDYHPGSQIRVRVEVTPEG